MSHTHWPSSERHEQAPPSSSDHGLMRARRRGGARGPCASL